jgi:hypothetical protein
MEKSSYTLQGLFYAEAAAGYYWEGELRRQ